MDKHYLTPLFRPASINVFAGRADDPALPRHAAQLHEALRAQRYAGTLNFLDIDTPGTLADLARLRADLALIALPPSELVRAIELASSMACRSAALIGSGIGAEQATQLKAVARREGIALLGPNSLGLQRPAQQLNAGIVGPLAAPGPLALVSQSGALTAAMLDWARANAVGFSSVVSLGRHTGIDIADVLDYLATDGDTHSILVYLEGIVSARRFMSALRSAANAKPVVVLKAGRRPGGRVAAQTHSGAIVGSDDAFDAALRRAGAVRVHSFIELFSAARCLASRQRPVGKRLAVISNGGGPGVLAADWIDEIGLQLAGLEPAAAAELAPRLPAAAVLAGLIDVSEEATPEHYGAAIAAANADPEIDGVLAIHSPKIGIDPDAVAAALVQARRSMSKPLLTCWMGAVSADAGRAILGEGGIPSFATPEAAVGAFGNLATFYQNQLLLQQTPPPMSTLAKPDVEGARLIIESVLAERRSALTELESKTLLSSFLIPVTQTVRARSATEAMMLATQLGFPV
ncbi:MAG TPA: acetate--CoA ligase family protein, partial [Rubrivivax sp.]|nr:acetate--CoA ligase family protein [Rubrivivax sp.]